MPNAKLPSFSEKVKSALILRADRDCCDAAVLRGLFDFGAREDYSAPPVEGGCEDCDAYYVRGAFAAAGTVGDPERGYSIEFRARDIERAEKLRKILTENGIKANISHKPVIRVYSKSMEGVADTLTLIGASAASLQVSASQIMRGVRGKENRIANAEAANLDKLTAASQKQIRAISRFVELRDDPDALSPEGEVVGLPSELAETAAIRMANPMATLAELAVLHDPPITKSGVYHRLERIKRMNKR